MHTSIILVLYQYVYEKPKGRPPGGRGGGAGGSWGTSIFVILRVVFIGTLFLLKFIISRLTFHGKVSKNMCKKKIRKTDETSVEKERRWNDARPRGILHHHDKNRNQGRSVTGLEPTTSQASEGFLRPGVGRPNQDPVRPAPHCEPSINVSYIIFSSSF